MTRHERLKELAKEANTALGDWKQAVFRQEQGIAPGGALGDDTPEEAWARHQAASKKYWKMIHEGTKQ